MKFLSCTLMSVCVLAVACSETIDDLKVIRLRALSSPTPDLPQDVYPLQSSSMRLLEVTLQSKSNLAQLARSGELNIVADVYACGNRDLQLSASSDLFDKNGNSISARLPESANLPTEYRLYFVDRAQAHDNVVSGKPPVPAYNLMEEPVDVCVSLAGGSMTGVRVRSNTVRIESQALREAIAAAGLIPSAAPYR